MTKCSWYTLAFRDTIRCTVVGGLWGDWALGAKFWSPQVILGGRFCVDARGNKKTGCHFSSLSKNRGLLEIPCECSCGPVTLSWTWWLALPHLMIESYRWFCWPLPLLLSSLWPLFHCDKASLYSPSLFPSAWVLCICLLILQPCFFYLLSLSHCLELKLSQKLCDWFCQISRGTLQWAPHGPLASRWSNQL